MAVGWSEPKVETPKLDTRTEHFWTSGYTGPETVARWKKDFRECGYELKSEFNLGKDWVLFRFGPMYTTELDLVVHHNVEILTVTPEVVVKKKESRW